MRDHLPRLRCAAMLARPLALAAALCLVGCAHTPDAATSYGPAATDAIVRWERWRIDGIEESVLLRGRSRARPVALLLHGGPGVSETALFRHYVPALEDHFVMAYWDQPGTGRSYSAEALRRGLDLERVLADLDFVVDRLRERFARERLVLIGHSWGSALGVLYAQRHPEKVALYVGTGQVADMPAGERISWDYALARARALGEAAAVGRLQGIGPPPHGVDAMLVSRRHVERYGGTFANGLSSGRLILAALSAPEATLADLARFGLGNRASLEALWPAFSQLDLAARVPRLAVPVLVVQGADDRVTPTRLALQWLEALEAPCKRVLVVDGAAHNVPFERPGVFVDALARHADALIARRDAGCRP